MFCAQCGSEVLNGANFCAVCGTRAPTNEERENENDATLEEESSTIKEDVETQRTLLTSKRDRGNVPALICPKCSNNNVANVEVVYLQNVKSSSTDAIDWDTLDGGAIDWDTQTGLAKKLAPPKRPGLGDTAKVIIFLLLGGPILFFGLLFSVIVAVEPGGIKGLEAFISFFLFALLVPGAVILLFSIPGFVRMPAYKNALAKWKEQFVCPVCGTIFTPKKSNG